MAAKKKGGVGSAIGCVVVLVALVLGGLKFGPQVLARLRGPTTTVEWGQTHDGGNGIRVRVLSAGIETTALVDALGSRDGTDDLHVTLEIRNISDTPRTYHPPQLMRSKEPKLMDDQGREVHAVTYGDKARIEGQLADGEEIASHDKEIHDLVFKPPAEGTKHLLLDVDMAMFGGEGMARFRIPAEKVDGLR